MSLIAYVGALLEFYVGGGGGGGGANNCLGIPCLEGKGLGRNAWTENLMVHSVYKVEQMKSNDDVCYCVFCILSLDILRGQLNGH